MAQETTEYKMTTWNNTTHRSLYSIAKRITKQCDDVLIQSVIRIGHYNSASK